MEGISIADAMALTSRENEGGFNFGGVGGLILILLFFIIFGGAWGNGFGGRSNIQEGLSDLERDVLNGTCNTQKEILESRYTTQLGFQASQAQMSECCCDIKTAIHAEGEATRALIQSNTIQELRDRLALANDALTSQTISNNIISQLQPVSKPAYLTCSPYTAYQLPFGNCGCNGSIF